MDKLKDIFRGKDKKLLANLGVAFAAGVILIATSGIFSGNKSGQPQIPAGTTTEPDIIENAGESYELSLERRLEEALCLIDGAGSVKVMLTLSNGREIVVAENSEYNKKSTTESDVDGGVREIEELKTKSDKIVLSQKSDGNEPLVLKELSPKIEGVMIIAQGGDNPVVKDAITRAVQAALGVEIHKIQVLKMKNNIKEEQ